MNRLPRLSLVVVALLHAASTTLAADNSPASIEFFESKIRPVLVESCYPCHSGESGQSEGGLLLDSRDGLRAGGDSGAVVVLGNASESKLLSRIASASDDERMPPTDFSGRAVARNRRRLYALDRCGRRRPAR